MNKLQAQPELTPQGISNFIADVNNYFRAQRNQKKIKWGKILKWILCQVH